MSIPSDEALLAAHLPGDPRAFGELVARHERRIYGLCLRILGNLFGEDPPGSTRGGSTETTATAPRIDVASAISFDPFTDDPDKQENQGQAERAIDSDRSSFWQTEGYNQNFGAGGYKQGVGLVLDLGRSREVGQLSLALAPSGGSAVTIYGANDPRPPTLDGWTKLSGPATAGATARFELQGSYQYVLVWFTSLPQDEGGKFRGGISNVVLRS